MNTQPNELQMSDVIDFLNRLRQSEKEAWRYADELEQERKRLHEVNQMLVGALKEMRKKYGEYACEVCDKADDALAKAKEQA